ncbi:MAG: PKD domain-containing protein [Chloroflexi bacterium]|nr:PKD domain-containing protein [Chloroflexota bacterium]
MTVYEPVVANFNGTPTRGTAPLNVIFTNLSAGDFYTCLWDFGDGATSTACISPVHIYEALGTYTVALTVNGPGGTATETKTEYIIVEPNLLFLPLLRSADE